MADEVDPNTLSPEEYAKWKHKHVMCGVEVSEEEVSTQLGFKTVEDFRYHSKHVGEVNKIVESKLRDWFGGDRNHGQISFSIASDVTEYFCKQLKPSQPQESIV